MSAHCPTCICGKRAPVQSDAIFNAADRSVRRTGPGSIAWAEHLQAHAAYRAICGSSQSADRIAERGGFSYGELVEFLGREPETWQPR